jgi:GTPase-associated system helical domain
MRQIQNNNMEDNFLQETLKIGLFDIGDSDERFKWLQESITDLQKKFEENYSLLPKFTLVALDPEISDTEPVMIETEIIITSHWRAIRGKYTEMPRNIIRGVILNALYGIGMKNTFFATIINLAALSFYPYAKINSEKKLIDQMLTSLGRIAEDSAIEEWSLAEESYFSKLGTLKITGFKPGSVAIDKALLRKSLKDATQQTSKGYDPYNNPEEWAESFSTKSSDGISLAFNNALESFSKSLSPTAIETPVNKFFTDFKKELNSILKSSFSSLKAVERRSNLLWWKETLYSPSQKGSYREVDTNILPIILAADLNDKVPKITPVSVDYLLMDTLFILNDKQDNSISFTNYLSAISESEKKSILKPYFGSINEQDGRISITDFISLLINDRVTIDDFKRKTGIDSQESVTFSELSIIIFHDLLIQRLIAE